MKKERMLQGAGFAGILLAATALAQTTPRNEVPLLAPKGAPLAAGYAASQSTWETDIEAVSESIHNLRQRLSALTASATAVQSPAPSKFVSDKVGLKPGEWLRVDGDKGRIKIYPIASGPISYEVEFHPDQGTVPSQRAYGDSWAAYDAAKGLTLRSGKDLEIILKIGVPAKQPVKVVLETGRIEIGQLTGKIDAKLETGELDYDASALPADVCVNASTSEGSVTNHRDFRCKPGEANLHVHTGTLEVK
ncbi:MAG: hypothetical protein ACHQ49_14450 [Elusimicrobiota bacterium]